jgi:hypothetical protein
MKRLLNTLRACGLLMMSVGCQNTPPVTSELETVDTVQKSETQAAPASEVRQEAASHSRAAAPASKHRRMASTTPATIVAEPKASRPLTPVSTKYTLPAETQISVRLIDSVSTETNKAGDTFLASLAEPLTVDGVTLFAKDTSVSGKILTVQEPGRVSGVASISLQLTEIQPRKGSPLPLETQPFSETAKAEKKKDAAIIGAGTGIGTAIGAIAGGGKGAVIGAIAGGGSSSGYVLATKGKQLKYPSETLMTFKLAEPLTVTR